MPMQFIILLYNFLFFLNIFNKRGKLKSQTTNKHSEHSVEEKVIRNKNGLWNNNQFGRSNMDSYIIRFYHN